jgi:SpoVK/Ycf46/Vps4 family AAA+-type ATPase
MESRHLLKKTKTTNSGIDDDDDLVPSPPPPVMVIGATNRPNHVDGAILRRLPRQFRIESPDKVGRLQILRLTLGNHPLSREAQAYLPQFAAETVGYSGSDLKELCQCAALESIREVIREESKRAVTTKQAPPKKQLKQQEKEEKEEKWCHNHSFRTTGTSRKADCPSDDETRFRGGTD